MPLRKRGLKINKVEVLTGERLWRALGFKSLRSFQRAMAKGEIRIPLFPIPGQSRGVFARIPDVEAFRARRERAEQDEAEEVDE